MNAAEIVRIMSVEDLEGSIAKCQNQLLEIGAPAIKPLEEFLATEHAGTSEQTKHNTLNPCRVNYDAARETLRQIYQRTGQEAGQNA